MTILVSACLLGTACRYDGRSKADAAVTALLARHTLIPVCGEIFGGLPTPRTPAERRGARVMTKDGRDVTQAYRRGAEEVLRLARLYGARAAILKERSPSCGSGEIYDGTFSGTRTAGWGVTAELLRESGVRVYGESELARLTHDLQDLQHETGKTDMFRPMRRPKNAIPDEQAKKLLREEKRGVIAMNGDDGYPFAIPVDYFYDETAGKIYFHGAKSGYKVDALRRCDKVCFTVYGGEFYKNGHWAPYVQSVLVYGRCRLVENIAVTEARVRELAMKYYPSAEEVEAEIAKDLRAVQLYEITVEHMTGKQVHEK